MAATREEEIEKFGSEPHGMNAIQALKEIATGRADYVTEAQYLTRLRICSECPHKNKIVNVCNVCKCILPIKAKLARAACPDRRW